MHGSGNAEEGGREFRRTTPCPQLSVNFGWLRCREVWAATITAGMLLALASSAATGAQTAGNIAPSAKISVSSTRDGYPKENAIDGKMDTSWSTALGQVEGQWLQLDWHQAQRMSGVILHQTGLYVKQVHVQVNQDGKWVTIADAGVSRSEEHTSELQSLRHLVCRLLL